jgi:hypothetical protein
LATISDLLRLIAKPIFLKLGKGLKSSKTKYCLGEELDIRLDESVIREGDIRNICVDSLSDSEGTLQAEGTCILPDENGSFKFTSDSSVTITPIPNGLNISVPGGGGGSDWKTIIIRDESTQTRIAEDKTFYVINNINDVKAQLELPPTAKVGFRFMVIGINGGCRIQISVSGGQFLKYKGNNNESTLITDESWQDLEIFCYEENTRFKWLTY